LTYALFLLSRYKHRDSVAEGNTLPPPSFPYKIADERVALTYL